MNRTLIALLVALLTLNLVGTVYLGFQLHAKPRPAVTQLSPAQLEQLEKLFKLAGQFHAELEQVATRAVYPSEKEKLEVNEYLQGHAMSLHLARLELARAMRERSSAAGQRFVQACWGDDSFFSRGTLLFEVPKYRFAKYNNVTERHVPYEGVNLARLESITNEFRVLALSFIKHLSDA